MDVFFWFIDLLIPLTMLIFRILFTYKAPKEMNNIYGYRTPLSLTSQNLWNYAHRLAGRILIMFGLILTCIIIASKTYTPIKREILSLLHASINMIALLICIPIVEFELKRFKD